jgi:transcription factor SPN1
MSASPESRVASPAAPDIEQQDTDGREDIEREVADVEDKDDVALEAADLSDDESVLSEVDEAQFEDFNPDDVDIEDRPALDIDEENLKLIGRHKRKRGEDEGGPKKRKEGRREKKNLRSYDVEGDDADGKRARRREKTQRRRTPTPEAEENLDPATSK